MRRVNKCGSRPPAGMVTSMGDDSNPIRDLGGTLYFYDERENAWVPCPDPIPELHFEHDPLQDPLPVRQVNLSDLGVTFTVSTENLPQSWQDLFDLIEYGGKLNVNRLIPDKIIKNGRATIVLWPDGTKTVVKLADGDEPSDYAAFTAALAKKVYGSNSAIKAIVRDKLEDQNNYADVFKAMARTLAAPLAKLAETFRNMK